MGGLQRNIQVTDTQLKNYETQVKQATKQLKELELKLAKAQKTYQTKQENAADRLRFLQRQQDTGEWATLLQSKTLEQLLERRHQLKRVYESERQNLVTLKTERDRVNEQKLQVETKKNQIAPALTTTTGSEVRI